MAIRAEERLTHITVWITTKRTPVNIRDWREMSCSVGIRG